MSPTSGVIGEAWGIYKTHWRHLLTLSFVTYLVVAMLAALLAAILTWVGVLIGLILTFVAAFWLQAALVKAVEDVRDGRADMSFQETFQAAKPHLGSVIVAGILAGIAIAIGLVLLIAPGLYLLTIWSVIVPVIVLEGKERGRIVLAKPGARPGLRLARARGDRAHGAAADRRRDRPLD